MKAMILTGGLRHSLSADLRTMTVVHRDVRPTARLATTEVWLGGVGSATDWNSTRAWTMLCHRRRGLGYLAPERILHGLAGQAFQPMCGASVRSYAVLTRRPPLPWIDHQLQGCPDAASSRQERVKPPTCSPAEALGTMLFGDPRKPTSAAGPGRAR